MPKYFSTVNRPQLAYCNRPLHVRIGSLNFFYFDCHKWRKIIQPDSSTILHFMYGNLESLLERTKWISVTTGFWDSLGMPELLKIILAPRETRFDWLKGLFWLFCKKLGIGRCDNSPMPKIQNMLQNAPFWMEFFFAQ